MEKQNIEGARDIGSGEAGVFLNLEGNKDMRNHMKSWPPGLWGGTGV